MSQPLKIWHPFTQEALDPPPIRIVRAEGIYLHTADGRRLVDAISSWWVNLHGHGHPAIVEAIAKQAAKLDHVLAAGFTHDSLEELRALGRITDRAKQSDRSDTFSADIRRAIPTIDPSQLPPGAP